MPIGVIKKVALPRTNVLVRLNSADTKFLLQRITDAVERGTGVNLILHNLPAAACIIETKERGTQISLNAYSDNISHRVETPMKGYNGPWSHIELVMDIKLGQAQLKTFVSCCERR